MMELRHLRYFVAIAEEGSFTRASERLWVAQPGLSAQIRRLEKELEVKLFERHTRGVTLTAAGELLLERARPALAAAELAGATGHDFAAGFNGTVRLGLSGGAGWSGTARALEAFATDRPGVELTVLEAHGGTLWRDLRDGRLDAVIAPSSFRSGDLCSLALGNEPWVALIGTGHRLAGSGPLDPEQLHEQPIAITGHRDAAGYERAVTGLLDELGVTPVLVRGAPGPARDAAVAAGEAIVLSTAPAALAPGVTTRALDTSHALEMTLLWRDETSSPALSAFVETARSHREPDEQQTRRLSLVA
jgi:DNA-binding transcriptional LysR family regulator